MATTIFKLPDSGQLHCYDRHGHETLPAPGDPLYGQDGCFRVNPLAFAKLDGEGREMPDVATWQDGLRMIFDRNTGLTWEVKSPQSGDLNDTNATYSWLEAQEGYVRQLNARKYGGFDDWRLPNKDELRSIVDYSRANPAVDLWYFPHCQTNFYWCANTYEMQPYCGWGIFFGLGSGIISSKECRRHARAVRGGHDRLFGQPDLSRFSDNGDGTITDKVTGLMWQKGENARMNWYDALNACQKMELAGYADWRLPNIKELNTILNLTYQDGWWYYKTFFPADGLQPPLLHYFSSTSYEKTYAWVTNFCFGYDGYYANKNATLLFRAVRHIEPPQQPTVCFVLPDSGQACCYDDEGRHIAPPQKGEPFYGQDGMISLAPMSFVKLRDGGNATDEKATWEQGWRMVKDEQTGLIWETKSPMTGDLNGHAARYSWEEAHAYIDRLNSHSYGGFSDWRLPNREELRTIVNYNDQIPAVDTAYFPTMPPEFYWSKDVYGADITLAWGIYFAYGCAICYLKENRYAVQAVRGGYKPEFGDTTRYLFLDNGDGTVTDVNAGLMWQQTEVATWMTQAEALKYCETLRLGGYDDWRLPTQKEIATLLDLSYKDSTWFHKEFFPNVITKPQGFYAASTTFGATFGWGVNFQFGYDGYYADKKNGRYPFRPVRRVK